MEIVHRARGVVERAAVRDERGTFSYGELLAASAAVAASLLRGGSDLAEARVAFMVAPGFSYAALQWGIWRAGGVAVPLCLSHPAPELDHVLADSGANLVVADPAHWSLLEPLCAMRSLPLREAAALTSLDSPPASLPVIGGDRRAMLIYTSGTTGKPKGAVSTHGQLEAQIATLVAAWGWSAADHVLNVLPLHHVHGVVNVLGCALWSGALWHTLPRFEAEAVWRAFAGREPTLFMAVPTIYHRLIRAWEEADGPRREAWAAGARQLRLMVSGSAALPVQVLERWREITGHTLLERYGMTEIGMALSNPLVGERRPGFVGQALPGVEVRVVDDAGNELPTGEAGELWVRGPGVFREYWGRPAETAAAFRAGGWFATGDEVVCERGSYRVLGRRSVDVLKSGGFKISALEIEAALRNHPAIADAAVVGLPDPEWGQLVAAGLVLRPGSAPDLDELSAWARQHLAPYKVPRRFLALEDLPRNALGKVVKGELARLFSSS